MIAGPAFLVIEDSPEDVEVLHRAFKKLSFDRPIHTCESADIAWRYLREKAATPRQLPSVILLDLNLPGTDGRVFLRRLKGEETLKAIPVVVLSTSQSADDIEFCYRHGAAAYQAKVMDVHRQIEAIRHMVTYWFDTVLLVGDGQA